PADQGEAGQGSPESPIERERAENLKQTIRDRTTIDKSDPKAVGEFLLDAIKSGNIDLGTEGSIDPQKIKEALAVTAGTSKKAAALTVKKFFSIEHGDLGAATKWYHTPRFISELHPEFRPIFERALAFDHERQEKTAILGQMLEPYFRLSRADRKKLDNRLIKARFRKTTEIKTEGLNQAQLEAFAAVRLAFETSFRWMEDTAVYLASRGKVKSADLLNSQRDVAEALLNADLGISDEELDSRAAKVWDALESLRETRRKGYVPFSRFGNWKYGIIDTKTDKPVTFEARQDPVRALWRFQKLKKAHRKKLASGEYRAVKPFEDTKKFPEVFDGLGGIEFTILLQMAKVDPDIQKALEPMMDYLKRAGFR
ncbi:hypothetical protein LCGC14_2975850, partial [marine sediment metagenome]